MTENGSVESVIPSQSAVGEDDTKIMAAEFQFQPIEMLPFNLWVLSPVFSMDEIQRRFANHPLVGSNYGINTVISFLMGKWKKELDVTTSAKIFLFIHSHLDSFVAGILVLDYMRQWDMNGLLEFYRVSKKLFPVQIMKLVELYLLVRVQAKLLLDSPDTSIIAECPDSVKDKLSPCASSNLYKMDSKVRLQIGDDNLKLLTNKDYSACLEMTNVLLDMVKMHVSASALKCNEEKVLLISYLNKFVFEFMSFLPVAIYPSAVQILIKTAQQFGVATRRFWLQTDSGGKMPLDVHANLLEALGCKITENDKLLAPNATPKDTESFIELLYDWDQVKEISEKVHHFTIGVCEIAERIGFADVWDFLFNGNEFSPTLFLEADNETVSNLLPLLFKLKKEQEIYQFIVSMPALFYPCPSSSNVLWILVSKLSPDQIVSFVEDDDDVLWKYKCLIIWAHAVENVSCNDPMNAGCSDLRLKTIFGKVKHALKFTEMKKKYVGKLLQLGFITPQDLGHLSQ